MSQKINKNSLPRVKIALALPLGIEAFSEWMDIEFTKTVAPQQVKSCLNGFLPEGIKLLYAESIEIKRPSLSQDLEKAVWSFFLKDESKSISSSKEWENKIEKLLLAKSLVKKMQSLQL